MASTLKKFTAWLGKGGFYTVKQFENIHAEASQVPSCVLFSIKEKKAARLSEEALQIGEKRREPKGKGERETNTQLNAGFQRIARRDNKAFLSDQCKEIE